MDAGLDVSYDVASAKEITVPVAQDASVLDFATCQRGQQANVEQEDVDNSESEDDLTEDVDDIMNNAFFLEPIPVRENVMVMEMLIQVFVRLTMILTSRLVILSWK